MPTEIYAVGRSRPEVPSDDPGYVQVHLGFPDGGMALIDRWTMRGRQPAYFSLTMIGSNGAAYVDDHHNTQLLYRDDRAVALNAGHGRGHITAQLQEFVDAIEGRREPAITGADGRAATLVAEAVAQSMASGRAARLAGGRYELV